MGTASRMQLTASIVFSLLVVISQSARINGPYVESYWESWDFKDYPEDFAAELKDVPASKIGSRKGVNIVDLSFGDYSPGLGGLEAPLDIITEGIAAIHAAGGLVKVAYGGALYSMSQYVKTEEDAVQFCKALKDTFATYHLDGLDLDVEDGGTSPDIQAKLISECRRELGESAHITYTIPALVSNLNPWKDTIARSASILDAVNVMAYDVYWTGYNFTMDMEGLNAVGIPNSKIVWGLMPGHHDAGNEYTSVEQARAAADFVNEQGLAGLMTWSINRDTDHRMGNSAGTDNLYQTGLPDATFINAISDQLNA